MPTYECNWTGTRTMTHDSDEETSLSERAKTQTPLVSDVSRGDEGLARVAEADGVPLSQRPPSPPPRDAEGIHVSFQDVLDRRAYIRLPWISKLLLLHWMGAPWSDKDPDACLSGIQAEVLAHREREKIVHGGSGLGKSVTGGAEQACDLMVPFTKNVIAAQRYDHVGAEFQYVHKAYKNLFADHRQALSRIVYKHQSNYHDYQIRTIWESETYGVSLESDEGNALLGREFYRCTVGEGANVSQRIYEHRIRRALDRYLSQSEKGMFREGGYLSCYTTATGYEGFSASRFDQVTKQTKGHPENLHYGLVPYQATIWVREASVLENPVYDRGAFDAAKETLTPQAFAEQYLGKMVHASGRVYDRYTPHLHRIAMPSAEEIRKMRLAIGIDPGTYYAVTLCGIDRDRVKYVLGEVYTEQQGLKITAELTRRMIEHKLGPVFDKHDYMDLRHVIDYWVIDPSWAAKLEVMEELDINITTPFNVTGEKLELTPSVDRINDWWGSGMLFLADDLTLTDEQIRKYVWKSRKGAKARGAAGPPVIVEPKKEFDHILDAFRYALFVLEVAGPREEAPPAITFKQAWDNAQRDRILGPLRAALAHAEKFGGMS